MQELNDKRLQNDRQQHSDNQGSWESESQLLCLVWPMISIVNLPITSYRWSDMIAFAAYYFAALSPFIIRALCLKAHFYIVCVRFTYNEDNNVITTVTGSASQMRGSMNF